MPKEQFVLRALHKNVLCVAVVTESYWYAYVRDVPGFNHEQEAYRVTRTGARMQKDHAVAVFPEFSAENYGI